MENEVWEEKLEELLFEYSENEYLGSEKIILFVYKLLSGKKKSSITAKQIVSLWEDIKTLIARENIYADNEIRNIDLFFDVKLKEEME